MQAQAPTKKAQSPPVISPWNTGVFAWQAPTLGALVEDEAHKLGVYRKVLFENVLCKLILKGEESAASLQSLCRQLLEAGTGVDRIMLGALSASTLAESEAAWNCLTALLSPDLEPAKEDQGSLWEGLET